LLITTKKKNNHLMDMVRLASFQPNHDSEVCRLAQRFADGSIWSSSTNVTHSTTLPQFTLNGVDYEPDVFLSQCPVQETTSPVFDWILEVETSDSIGIEHTKNQLTAFASYAQSNASIIIVLVPNQDVNTMRYNLQQWGLGNSVRVEQWGWPSVIH